MGMSSRSSWDEFAETTRVEASGRPSSLEAGRWTGSLLPGGDRDPMARERDAKQVINPMDKLAGDYDRWFETAEGKQLFGIELSCVREVIGDPVGRWVEVGVGTGRFASALGIHEGVDPSKPALLLAGSRGIETHQGTAEKLPYPDGSLDGLLLVMTLCFVADARIAMDEFQRVLAPGGRLVIGMIPADSAWGRLYAEKGRQGHPFYSSAHIHTVDRVMSWAADAGFTLVRARSGLLNPPSSPQTDDAAPGILEHAGFVCLGFITARSMIK